MYSQKPHLKVTYINLPEIYIDHYSCCFWQQEDSHLKPEEKKTLSFECTATPEVRSQGGKVSEDQYKKLDFQVIQKQTIMSHSNE